MAFVEVEGERIGMDYSKKAYSLFPRYRLNEAVLIETEKMTGQQFRSLEEARKLIQNAGNVALSSLLEEFQKSPEARTALLDEGKAFENYVSNVDPVALDRIAPLPYRRVLADSESELLRRELSARWGVKGYWYPLSECDPQTNVVAFHRELWQQRRGTSLLMQALQERSIERCFLLLEGPVDFEIAQSLVNPIYKGDEAFITTDLQWLVYSSHESSIAVAGWLADFFRSRWEDWECVTYEGPFHTDDLRGTWKIGG